MVNMEYINAQSAVLGALLISPELTGEVMTKVRPEDFENNDCRLIYQAITGLFLEGKVIDPVLVRERLSGFADMGETLRQIMVQTPTAANIWAYVEILQEQSRLAKLRAIGSKLFEVPTVEEAMALISEANGIFSSRPGVTRKSAEEILSDFYARHSEGKHPEYLSWSFPKMDDKLYTELGDFNVIGGAASAGKTALALQFAWHQAQKYRVGFYSLETNDKKLGDRSISTLTGVNMGVIKRSTLTDKDWRRLADCSGAICKRSIDFIQASGMTVDDLRADALAHRYEIIYVDYLQLLKVPKVYDRTAIVTSISIGLHELSQSNGITVVALSQLNRDGQNGAPTMSSLRESGQIEQDADTIMLLYREDNDDPYSRRVLKFPKNKEGVIGLIYLDFDGATQTFSESVGETGEEKEDAPETPEYMQEEFQAVTTRRRDRMRG